MTVYLRDMSDNDSNEDMSGFVGTTHKATEGTKTVHHSYGPRLNKFRSQGIPVLGSYHVVRTPGSGGHGSLSSQLDFWLSTMDKATPWWRTYPHFILQIDLEKWPYDQVSATVGMQFADLLVSSGVPGWKVTYASRGQYGNSLTGISTPLWNAAYHSSSYAGDSASDWAPYSGRVPVLWQYTSTPFDKNAFRGQLDDLLAMIGGDSMSAQAEGQVSNIYTGLFFGGPSCGTPVPDAPALNGGKGNSVFDHLGYLERQVAKVLTTAAGGPTQTQVDTAVAAVMNDPAWLAKLGAALASHIKVS